VKIISIFTIPPANAGNPSPDEMERMGAYITELRERGILKGEGKYYVSLAHTAEDVRFTLDAFASATKAFVGT